MMTPTTVEFQWKEEEELFASCRDPWTTTDVDLFKFIEGSSTAN